ncbi:MAG TPA: DinB family protein [Candidatus Limnocylindrales bacterium]|nr:DinB family protein [Candidatus Limnocylindrales bacterium]
MYPPGLAEFHEGWAGHQQLLIAALRDLTPEQLALRTAPHQWAVWQLAAHIAGTRAYWFHDVLGQGDPAVRDMFRVERSTVPGVSLEDAGWEDDESRPRTAAELVDGLERSWSLVDECLRRWGLEDLAVTVERKSRALSRGWVIYHVLEHDIHHGGEISQILGSNGLPPLDV